MAWRLGCNGRLDAAAAFRRKAASTVKEQLLQVKSLCEVYSDRSSKRSAEQKIEWSRPFMTEDLIPADIQDFIVRHIHSIAQLEALLLLRANAHEKWDAIAVATRLYTSEKETADLLAQLCAARFVQVSGSAYQYDPAPEHALVIDRLALIYSRHLIPVTNMIHGKTHRIRQFSDAFKITRGKD